MIFKKLRQYFIKQALESKSNGSTYNIWKKDYPYFNEWLLDNGFRYYKEYDKSLK